MRHAVLAPLLALAGAVAAYAALVAVGALAGGWDAGQTRDQALALSLHLGVVFLRGLLPITLATVALAAAARRARLAPGAPLALGAGLVAALVLVPSLLALPVDLGPIPHLAIDGPVNWLATIALLGLGAGTALHLARLV